MNVVSTALRFFKESHLQCNFLISIDGIIENGFRQCSGLEEKIGGSRVRENNVPLPTIVNSKSETGIIILKQGLGLIDNFYAWYKERRDWGKGSPDFRRSVSIIQLKWVKNFPVEVDRWDFEKVIPVSYKTPDFNSMGDEISIIEMKILPCSLLDKPLEGAKELAAEKILSSAGYVINQVKRGITQ